MLLVTVWIIKAGDSDVLVMFTVVYSPAGMWTFADIFFCSIAADVVQPNSCLADTVVAIVHLSSDVSVTLRYASSPTTDCCTIVTKCLSLRQFKNTTSALAWSFIPLVTLYNLQRYVHCRKPDSLGYIFTHLQLFWHIVLKANKFGKRMQNNGHYAV